MKCDELKVYEFDTDFPNSIQSGSYYDKDDADAAIAELKAKLESVQATAYAESVDAGMENRNLKRALWLARAWGANQRTKYLDLFLTGRAHAIRKYKWIKITSKCRAKAEEYK